MVDWQHGRCVLNDALETLELAEHSGGDCVCVEGEFNQEFAAWKEEMSTGNPFVNVVAQDIMEPFPAVLQLTPTSGGCPHGLRNSGIPVRPYVDRDGTIGRFHRRG